MTHGASGKQVSSETNGSLTGSAPASAWRVIRRLGAGWSSTVDLVEIVRPVAGLEPGRIVACKAFRRERLLEDPHLPERIRREVRNLARVVVDSVPRFFGVVEADGMPQYVLMEFIDGDSLQSLLDAGRRLDVDAWSLVARDLVVAVQGLHAAEMTHRDIKPANIGLRRNGRACLLDFGVSRSASDPTITATRDFLGTIAFAHPKYLNGETYEPRFDWYSLGVSLWPAALGWYICDPKQHFVKQIGIVREGRIPGFWSRPEGPLGPHHRDLGVEHDVQRLVLAHLLRTTEIDSTYLVDVLTNGPDSEAALMYLLATASAEELGSGTTERTLPRFIRLAKRSNNAVALLTTFGFDDGVFTSLYGVRSVIDQVAESDERFTRASAVLSDFALRQAQRSQGDARHWASAYAEQLRKFVGFVVLNNDRPPQFGWDYPYLLSYDFSTDYPFSGERHPELNGVARDLLDVMRPPSERRKMWRAELVPYWSRSARMAFEVKEYRRLPADERSQAVIANASFAVDAKSGRKVLKRLAAFRGVEEEESIHSLIDEVMKNVGKWNAIWRLPASEVSMY